jgi:hypothetical protein
MKGLMAAATAAVLDVQLMGQARDDGEVDVAADLLRSARLVGGEQAVGGGAGADRQDRGRERGQQARAGAGRSAAGPARARLHRLAQLFPQVAACSVMLSRHPGSGGGMSVVAGHGVRVIGGGGG